ncbi:hypothetical protein [Bremerella cremea]|uniref:hypothetical protein n=1 Tax=Bremerella cremea TaxID=1031537 RepID=UPI0031E8BBD2
MKYFFYDQETQEGIDADDAAEGTEVEIVAAWNALTPTPGSFLGIFETDDKPTLQFMWEEEEDGFDKPWLDIPVPDRQGSYRKIVTREEAAQLLKQTIEGSDPTKIPGLDFEAW